MTKEAEKRVRDLANYYGWFRHKYGDVRYCIHCHQPLPKTERAPDYFVAQVGHWVEAKNNDATGTWRCAEIYEDGERSNQRQFLNENPGGWLFIELSEGRAPQNSSAYLIPWDKWIELIEPILISKDMKSIRRETTYKKCGNIRRLGADVLFKDYELEWKPTYGWIIPGEHCYWQRLKESLEKGLEQIRKVINGQHG